MSVKLKIFIWAVILLLLFYRLPSLPVIDGDEAFNAIKARVLLIRGNWIDIYSAVESKNPEYTGKPPLTIWADAVSIKLLGDKDIAIKLWHILASLLVIIITFLLARLIYSEEVAYLSIMLLSTSGQFFYQSRVTIMDIPLTLFISGGLLCFCLWERQKKKLVWYYLFWVFLGLGVLAKGLVALALVLPAIIIWLWQNKKKPWLEVPYWWWHTLTGIIFMAAIGGWWFVVEYIRFKQQFLYTFFYENTFHRYLKIHKNITSFYPLRVLTFPAYLLLGTLPWSSFTLATLVEKDLRKSLLFWVVVWTVAFFSISPGGDTIIRYILPLYPAWAIITGYTIWKYILGKRNLEKIKKLLLISTICLFFLIALILAIKLTIEKLALTTQELKGYLNIILPSIIIILIAGTALSILANRRNIFKLVIITFLISALGWLLLVENTISLFPQVVGANMIGEYVYKNLPEIRNVLIYSENKVFKYYLHNQNVKKFSISEVKNTPKPLLVIIPVEKIKELSSFKYKILMNTNYKLLLLIEK